MFKNKIGEDSPIPKFIYLKIRRRDGVESLTILEEGEFKVSIDDCISMGTNIIYVQHLTDHNWQKWKRVFLTCSCHKIYSDEAVGLKSCKYTWKITIFVKMWNLGQYHENLIFCQ